VRYARLRSHTTPPEGFPPLTSAASPRFFPRLMAVAALVWGCLMVQPAAAGEDRILLQGHADGTVWDETETTTKGQLRLWVAGQIAPGLQGMVLGRFENGGIDEYSYVDPDHTELEQAWVRYSFPVSVRLVAQAGKMPQPIGAFSRRYLASQNPLIGAPANYDIDYPYAVALAGRAGHVDFTAAVMDRPLGHQIWLPEPSSAPRPALAAGVTPFTGFRLGAYATWGPYLSSDTQQYVPSGYRWREYTQHVLGFDLQFSRGHFELNGEMTRSLFEMPEEPQERGVVWYLEPKYTWSPRWFTAMRILNNKQTSVWLPDYGSWYVTDENIWDVETGAGFRIDPRTLVKGSYRFRRSTEYPSYGPETDHGVALQLSWSFDVKSWFERPQ